MTQTNYEEFQELVEQFEPEMSLKAIWEQEGVCYRSYISWRNNHGLGKARKRKPVPAGMVEMEIEEMPRPDTASMVSVQMEFGNGLRFSREGMDVDGLIEFLTRIKPVLCLS